MVQFKSGVLFKDNDPKDGVVVLGVNCQGITTFSEGLHNLEKIMPNTFKLYIKKCITDDLAPGDVFFSKENGYDVALIVINEYLFGTYQDVPDIIEMDFEACVDTLIEQCGASSFFVSDILGRPFNVWGDLQSIIAKKKLNWTVYRD